MLRLVRRPRGLIPPLCALLVALTGVAASAAAQTFSVKVNGGSPGYGRGTVTSSPAGIDCTFVGKDFEINGTGTCQANFPAGSTVVLSVVTNDGTTLAGWSDDCAAFTSSCTLVMDQNRLTRVILNPAKFKVTVVLTGNGAGNVVESFITTLPRLGCGIADGQMSGTCELDYPLGSRVTLEFRIPFSSGTRFTGFNDPPCVETTSCRALVNGPITITGAFVTPEIRITGAGTGSGRVVGSAPSGVDCTVTPTGTTGTCARVFDKNTPAPTTFTATPSEGSFFVGWSGLCSGTGACTTLGDLPPNGALVARFDAQPAGVNSLFLNSNGGFGRGHVTSSPAGIDCDFSNPASTDGTGTCRGDFAVGTVVQLTATGRDGTKVLGFTGDCASASDTCTVNMFHDRRTTVQLDPARFPITIVTSGNGSGTVNDLVGNFTPRLRCTVTRGLGDSGCTGSYPFGATTRLFAGPAGSSKVSINETTCVTAPCTITGPVTVTATFSAPAINIVGAGTGSGRVTDTALTGLNCMITPGGLTGSCSKVFDMTFATVANFVPVPATGSVFVGYTGLCTGIQACSTSGDFPPNTQLIARFDLESSPSQGLTILGAGHGAGVVQSTPAGIACTITNGAAGSGCGALFPQGAIVTLEARPTFPSSFVGWQGPCTGTGQCILSLAQAQVVTARFEPNANATTLTIVGAGTGNGVVTISPGSIQCPISGGGVVDGATCLVGFEQSAQVTLTAEGRFGSTFGGWQGDECASITEPVCTFLLSGNKKVAAVFISPHSPHDLTLALVGRFTLTADERAQLDKLGNNNGRFDLGDVLAYLDRTGQQLTSTDAAPAATRSRPAAPTATKPRRVP